MHNGFSSEDNVIALVSLVLTVGSQTFLVDSILFLLHYAYVLILEICQQIVFVKPDVQMARLLLTTHVQSPDIQ